MDCRATDLYTASFPGKAGFSRRHDGLRDRIYREAARAGLLAHRENAVRVVEKGTYTQQGRANSCRLRPVGPACPALMG